MDPKAIGTALAKATREFFTKAMQSRDERIAALEARLAELESKAVEYRGVWKPDTLYPRGTFITRSGSVWHANAPTYATPGDSPDWVLAVKRGQDGRDLR